MWSISYVICVDTYNIWYNIMIWYNIWYNSTNFFNSISNIFIFRCSDPETYEYYYFPDRPTDPPEIILLTAPIAKPYVDLA